MKFKTMWLADGKGRGGEGRREMKRKGKERRENKAEQGLSPKTLQY